MRDPQGLNSYSYAGNNPVKNIDSTGNSWGTAFDLAIFALSVNDYKENPTVGNAIFAGIDGLSMALPGFPAVIGGVRHADEVAKMAGNMLNTSQEILHQSKSSNVLKMEKLRLTDHVADRMFERNISLKQIENTIMHGDQFKYLHDGVTKKGYYDTASKIFIGTHDKSITTTMKTGSNYVKNLKNSIK